MKTIARMLTVTGLGIAAAVTFGGAPAMASGSADARIHHGDRDRVIHYFDNYRECEFAADWLSDRGRWDDDDYDCERVYAGRHRGDVALVAERDYDDNWYRGIRRYDFDRFDRSRNVFPFLRIF